MSRQQTIYNLLDSAIVSLADERKRLSREHELGQITNPERHERFNAYYIKRLNDVAQSILETKAQPDKHTAYNSGYVAGKRAAIREAAPSPKDCNCHGLANHGNYQKCPVTTSNISNDSLDKIYYAHFAGLNDADKAWPEAKQALTKYIQQEKSALLNELLEQKKVYITELAWKHAAHEYAVEVSVIEAKLAALTGGSDD